MRGWVVTVLGGVVLGVTSYWHGHAGGAGTSGLTFGAVLLAAMLVVFAVGAWSGGAR